MGYMTIENRTAINAPTSIVMYSGVFSSLLLFIIAVIIAGLFNKDFETKFSNLLFTKPISKLQYLGGLLLANLAFVSAIFLLAMLTFAITSALPFISSDMVVAPNILWYLQPFLLFTLPNFFLFASLLMLYIVVSKRTSNILLVAFLLMMLQGLAELLDAKIDNKVLAALIDPLGEKAAALATIGWTSAENNTQMLPLTWVILVNRLIWIGAGFVAFFSSLKIFNYDFSFKSRKKHVNDSYEITECNTKIKDFTFV
jgi:ABC-2 type transport system permease protein